MKTMMAKLRACYAGHLGRRGMLRPVLLRSFPVLLLCAVAYYLLYKDISLLSMEKKALLLAGNTEDAQILQQVMELFNLWNGVLLGAVLYMGYIIWLVLCSTVFVRRFRDAGLNPNIYGILFALFAWSGLLIEFSGLSSLPYEAAIGQLVRSMMIEGGCVIFSLLILAALALRRSA